jgi:formylglycine-generating enzyme required for sulfatase activity
MNVKLLIRAALVVTAIAGYAASEPKNPLPSELSVPDSMVGKEPGDVREDNLLKMKLVWCPGGFITMEQAEGDDDHLRINPVKAFLSHGYWLGKYEVTKAEWRRVMATEPWMGDENTKLGDDFPATHVSWEDTMDFCRKLTQAEREAGRLPDNWEYTLPTEAQWERACRARTETAFSFGDDASEIGEYVWYGNNATKAGEPYAHRVGRK